MHDSWQQLVSWISSKHQWPPNVTIKASCRCLLLSACYCQLALVPEPCALCRSSNPEVQSWPCCILRCLALVQPCFARVSAGGVPQLRVLAPARLAVQAAGRHRLVARQGVCLQPLHCCIAAATGRCCIAAGLLPNVIARWPNKVGACNSCVLSELRCSSGAAQCLELWLEKLCPMSCSCIMSRLYKINTYKYTCIYIHTYTYI
jgi:hypothetical protein